mgnify:CR=1 FL=1
MIKQLKTLTVSMVGGANVATVAVMLAVGFADHIDPVSHPTLSCLGLAFPVFLVINLLFLFFWLVFKRRMALVPVVGFVLAYSPVSIYMPINLPEDMPDSVIKVLSYNVQNYSGMPRYDGAADMIVDYIRESDADIVCLQEDMAPAWAVRKSLDSIYAYTDTTRFGQRNVNAVGIYTRFPILRKERIAYASEGNGSVAYYLAIGGDTVIVINNHLETTHLSLDDRQKYKDMLKGEMENGVARDESKKLVHTLGGAAALRAPQADSVHKYVMGHKDYPIILCGDFNDNPISYARRVIAQGLTDCYVATGRGIGLSYNQKGFFVRIDNMMCSEDFKPYNCKVDNKIDASDHYPIFCWFKKRDKP